MANQLTNGPATAIHMYQALFGKAPSNALYNTYVTQATANPSAFAADITDSFALTSDAALALQVLNNLGITATTVTATGSYTTLLGALEQAFAGYGAASRGQIILNLTNLLANLEGDATYGVAATAYNNQALADFTYSTNTANTVSAVVTPADPLAGQTFTLTAGSDTGAAFTGGAGNDTFTAGVAIAANGTTLVDALQNVDMLAGGLGNDTLNVTLNGAAVVTPTLTSIENVVLRVTAAASALDLIGSTGVTSVTIANSNVASTAAAGTVNNVGTAALAVKNQNTAVSFNNSTATALSLTVDTVGVVSATAPTQVVVDLGKTVASKATTLNLTANASNVEVKDSTAGSIVTTATIAATGANTIKLTDGVGSVTTLTTTGTGSVDLTGTAFTSALKTLTVGDGGIKITGTNSVLANLTATTGAGADTLTFNGGNFKSITTGAGNDAVTATVSAAAVALTTAINVPAADLAAVAVLTAAAVAAGTITAAQKVTIDGAATVAAAGVASGVVDATAAAIAATATVDLGLGNDSLTMASAFAAGATLTGGDGTDTIGFAKAGYATVAAYSVANLAKVTGFEVLSITDALTTGDSIDVSKIVGIGSFTAAAGVGTGTTTAAAINLGAASTVTLAGTAANNGTLNVSLKTDTAADSMTLVLNKDYTDNNDTTTDALAAAHTVVAADIETMTINSTGKMGAIVPVTGYKADLVTNTLTLTSSNKLVTVSVTGDQALNFSSTAAMTKLATIDGSANTGGLTFNGSLADVTTPTTSAAMTITGSATAANTLTGSGNVDTITGGAGKDTITGGLGGDALNGGLGNDTFVYTAAAQSTLANMDVITGFSANTYGNGASGAAGTGANATATTWTGDVLKFTAAGAVAATGLSKISVQTNAADAQTYLQNIAADATANEFAAVLDSSTGRLYVDLDANGIIDSVISLTGVTTITAAAFVIV